MGKRPVKIGEDFSALEQIKGSLPAEKISGDPVIETASLGAAVRREKKSPTGSGEKSKKTGKGTIRKRPGESFDPVQKEQKSRAKINFYKKYGPEGKNVWDKKLYTGNEIEGWISIVSFDEGAGKAIVSFTGKERKIDPESIEALLDKYASEESKKGIKKKEKKKVEKEAEKEEENWEELIKKANFEELKEIARKIGEKETDFPQIETEYYLEFTENLKFPKIIEYHLKRITEKYGFRERVRELKKDFLTSKEAETEKPREPEVEIVSGKGEKAKPEPKPKEDVPKKETGLEESRVEKLKLELDEARMKYVEVGFQNSKRWDGLKKFFGKFLKEDYEKEDSDVIYFRIGYEQKFGEYAEAVLEGIGKSKLSGLALEEELKNARFFLKFSEALELLDARAKLRLIGKEKDQFEEVTQLRERMEKMKGKSFEKRLEFAQKIWCPEALGKNDLVKLLVLFLLEKGRMEKNEDLLEKIEFLINEAKNLNEAGGVLSRKISGEDFGNWEIIKNLEFGNLANKKAVKFKDECLGILGKEVEPKKKEKVGEWIIRVAKIALEKRKELKDLSL